MLGDTIAEVARLEAEVEKLDKLLVKTQTRCNIYESFFNKLYIPYAISLNADKVKEALNLIYIWGVASGKGDEGMIDAAVLKMKEWSA